MIHKGNGSAAIPLEWDLGGGMTPLETDKGGGTTKKSQMPVDIK